jgi:hypothetical protein
MDKFSAKKRDSHMSISNSLSGKPPSNYREVLYWKINEKAGRIAMMNSLSIPLAIVFGIGFYIFVRMFGTSPKIIWDDNAIFIFLIGIPIVLLAHEFIHGVVMQSYGAKVKYGFWGQGLMFYAKAPGYAFKRYQYLIIVLGPLVILSILAGCGIVFLSGTSLVWLFAIWAILNASASNGDLWITAVVLRYPASTYIIDELNGMRIFMP